MNDSRSEENAHDGTSVVPESGEDNKITGVILKVFKKPTRRGSHWPKIGKLEHKLL